MSGDDTLIILVILFGLGACLAWLVLGHLSAGSRQNRSQHAMNVVAQKSPFPVWVESNGRVLWSNVQCKTEFFKSGQKFRGLSDFQPGGSTGSKQRGEWVAFRGEKETTFSIEQIEINSKTIVYAQDATQLAQTENELRRFVQTLSATFAHLPIGLAVFDKERDLTLFNPALSQLLGLPAEWLARGPSMRSFLDRLRNAGSIPEPKDYSTLRTEFAELESGAFTGKYEADWALPSGLIYRVTGRPHPQGGAALLFEDITRAAALEAKYRAELRQLYAALESLSDAVAIFDQAGELAYANDAFDVLWKCSLSTAVTPITVNDVSRLFQKHSLPTPVWGEFRNFVHDLTERSQWQAKALMTTGERLKMTFSPIADGRVFCEFRVMDVTTEGIELADTA